MNSRVNHINNIKAKTSCKTNAAPTKEERSSTMGDTAGFMGIMIYRWFTWVLLLFSCLLLSRFFILAQLRDINRAYHQWTPDPTSSRFTVPEAGVRDDKFLEVPQIVWGLNNQKIALARAALTARKLNRTLLMPNLSASLFYKETDLLEPLGFDRLFSLHRFNSLCNGFVRISSMNSRNFSDVLVGSGRPWTVERLEISALSERRCLQTGLNEVRLRVSKLQFWKAHVVTYGRQRHVDDAHFLVQIFDVSGYEKKNTVTVKNCESHNLNKLGIYGTGAATFGQTVKGNPFKDASGDANNVPRRITRSIGLKVAITENCAEACIPNGRRHSTVKQEFPAHPKINVKQEPRLPKSYWNFSENKVGSSAKDPIILDSEEEFDSQALSSYSNDEDSDEVSYHFSSQVLQGKVHPVEDKTANSVKKGKPKFTQVMKKSAVTHSFWLRLLCLSTVFIQIQRSPQIRWSSRSWLPGSARPSSWSATPAPYEKKKLGVLDIYSKYPYLIQSAIDYEVCLQADTFEGNSFSTFSSLIVLQRTMRMDRAQDCEGSIVASYAYNIEGPAGGPKRWATNMSDLSLAAISYGSNEVSCQ